MRKLTVLFCLLVLLSVMVACSEEADAFAYANIIFEVIDAQSDDERASSIKISNQTGFDLDNLTLKISNPLDAQNSSNSEAERETFEFMEDFNINSNESKELAIPHVINENNMELDLEGNVVEGNKKVPFKIGGSFSALSAKH